MGRSRSSPAPDLELWWCLQKPLSPLAAPIPTSRPGPGSRGSWLLPGVAAPGALVTLGAGVDPRHLLLRLAPWFPAGFSALRAFA